MPVRRTYTKTLNQQVPFKVHVKCEKCGHIYTYRKTLPANVSASSNRSYGISDNTLRERAKEARERIVQRVVYSGSNVGKKFEVYLPCPQCEYVQSWMQQLFIEKETEEIGCASFGVGFILLGTLFSIAISARASLVFLIPIILIPIGIGIAIYYFYEKPQLGAARRKVNKINEKMGHFKAIPPLKVEFLDPADEAYARSITKKQFSAGAFTIRASAQTTGYSDEVLQALKEAHAQHMISDEMLVTLAKGKTAEKALITLVNARSNRKISKLAFESLARASANGKLSDADLMNLIKERLEGEVSDAELIARAKRRDPETTPKLSLQNSLNH